MLRVTDDFHLSLSELYKGIKVDFVEENGSVMGTLGGRFALWSVSTSLKLAKACFRLVDIGPRVGRPSRVPVTDSLYLPSGNGYEFIACDFHTNVLPFLSSIWKWL